jgi:hypothetical protein
MLDIAKGATVHATNLIRSLKQISLGIAFYSLHLLFIPLVSMKE